MPSSSAPKRILIIGTGVFGLTLLWELSKRYPNSVFTVVSPSIPEQLAPAESSSSRTVDASAPRIASVDVNRIIRPEYKDTDYAELMADTMPRWRETAGLKSFYHECGLLLTSETGTSSDEYVRKSLENSKTQHRLVEEYPDAKAVSGAMQSSTAQANGSFGYLSYQSGWADAGGALGWVWEQVGAASKTVNMRFVRRAAVRLLPSQDGARIVGAQIEGGEETHADLTVLAAGAWSGGLLDFVGIASPRGQCIGYVDVTDDEARTLVDVPVLYNMGKGCFFFPPTRKESGGWEIKVARNAFGYAPSGSVPSQFDQIPQADHDLLISFLKTCMPSIRFQGRQLRQRMCWYFDTASSDFIGTYHPDLNRSLFVATGGSGHGFKFLPVLGERLADVLDGSDANENSGRWARKWAWPAVQREPSGAIKREIWCFDGSRAGLPGSTLEAAFADDRRGAEMPRSRL